MKTGSYIPAFEVTLHYASFEQDNLPIEVKIDLLLLDLYTTAGLLLGKLDGISSSLPNLDSVSVMFVFREALSSCKISGSTFNIMEALKRTLSRNNGDIESINSYIKTLNYGL